MDLAVRLALIALLLVVWIPSASADVITDWNERAVAAGETARPSTSAHTRSLAMVHLAMFEAVNSIEGRYMPYRTRLPAAPGISRDAAAAAAAHSVLVRLYPDQAKDLDKALQMSLGPVADGPLKAQGIRLGEEAAAAILAQRRADGSDAPNTYRPFTAPGMYVPTAFPVASSWGAVRPFALRTGSQVRPAAPYALTSREWAKD